MAEDPKSEFVASPNTSESNDADFQMNADMMVHDIDDERTIDEEEMMESGEEFSNEVNNLQKEGDMPIEDLLALYGYGGDGEHTEVPLEEIRPQPLHPFSPQKGSAVTAMETAGANREDDTQSISSEGSLSRASSAQSSNSREENGYDPFQNQRITRGIASLHAHYFENDDTSDDEYQPLADEWKKEVALGPDYQADVPEYLSMYKESVKVYENEDKLLWKPDVVDTRQLKKYLSVVFSSPEGEIGSSFRDDEQALYMLLQCGNVEEAFKKKGEQSKLPPDVTLWSEEECRNFELGLRIYGKDFRQIQRNKISHRTVGDIVQFYYLWKKTERYDAFCSQTRFGKKKYGAPGIADYMDRFMDEAESLVSSRSASPYSQNLVGNSSPAEVPVERTDQPMSTAQAVHPSPMMPHTTISATPRQQAMDTTGLRQSTQRPGLAMTSPYTTGTVLPRAKPLQPNLNVTSAPPTTKATGLGLFSSTTHAYNATIYNEPNHVIHPVSMPQTETLVVRGLDTWTHDSKLPIIEPVVFGTSNQGIYKLSQTSANQRAVTFGGGGFTTTSISQSVE